MEKLPICRICLVENVRMFVVNNRNLHELYEKLTDIPFVTEDYRPILACFFCCTKLKQCCQLLRKCLEAEELFAQMKKVDYIYETNPLINQDRIESYSGFIKSPIELISIVDECQTESIAIKEELPAVCEGRYDIIELKEEHQSDELESENLDNSCLDIADIPPQHSESDLEDDVPLMEFKSEVVDEKVSKKKRRARETKRATVAKKPKLDTRRTKLEDAVTVEQTTKEKSESKVIRTTQQRTSKPGTYKCDVCQRSFNRNSHLTYHIRVHTGEKPYKCDVCQRSFSRKSNLTYHIRIHTDKKPYKCDVCQRSFNLKSYLKYHIRIHTDEKPYKCDVCQRSYSRKTNLIHHLRIHSGEKPHKCDVCQRSFDRNGTLTQHMLIHTGEKRYKCRVCQRRFSVKRDLLIHFRTHTGEQLYKCDVCQLSFIQNNDLREHIRIHSGEKPYKCNICQRSFSRKGYLRKHIRIHTGKKPYKCNVCQRSFYEKNILTRHTRIHTGEKPYKCDVCQRSYSRKSNLIHHLRIHSGEKPHKR